MRIDRSQENDNSKFKRADRTIERLEQIDGGVY